MLRFRSPQPTQTRLANAGIQLTQSCRLLAMGSWAISGVETVAEELHPLNQMFWAISRVETVAEDLYPLNQMFWAMASMKKTVHMLAMFLVA